MENASKALIMAAEILLGVMIISIAVYLFNVFGDYSKETADKIADAQIAQFNNQFLKYTGYRTNEKDELEPVKVTIHDIASLANLAKKNNTEYELTKDDYTPEGTTFYIRIDIGNSEKYVEEYSEQKMIELIKKNALNTLTNEIKYYQCADPNIHISEHTKKVNYLKFVEIP